MRLKLDMEMVSVSVVGMVIVPLIGGAVGPGVDCAIAGAAVARPTAITPASSTPALYFLMVCLSFPGDMKDPPPRTFWEGVTGRGALPPALPGTGSGAGGQPQASPAAPCLVRIPGGRLHAPTRITIP